MCSRQILTTSNSHCIFLGSVEPEEWALGLIPRKALFGEEWVVEEVARNGETEEVTQRERGKQLKVGVWACQSLECGTHSNLSFLIHRMG